MGSNKTMEENSMKNFKQILKDEDGQGMVEYGLILGLIAIAAIAALILLGPKIKAIFTAANDAVPTVTT
jgi:pilus assembly protein Flp/PilA